MDCLQGTKANFVDAAGQQRTLVASRLAGTCAKLPRAIALFSVWARRDNGSSILAKTNDDHAPGNPQSISRRLI